MVWGQICITEKRSPWEKPWKLPLHERIRPPEKKRAPERPLRRWKWRDQTKKKKKRESERIRIKRNRSRYTWCGMRGSGAWRSHEIEGRISMKEGEREREIRRRRKGRGNGEAMKKQRQAPFHHWVFLYWVFIKISWCLRRANPRGSRVSNADREPEIQCSAVAWIS